MTWNAFWVTVTLCGESTFYQWIPIIKNSNAGLGCFINCKPEEAVKQTVYLPLIWDTMILMWRHCYVTDISTSVALCVFPCLWVDDWCHTSVAWRHAICSVIPYVSCLHASNKTRQEKRQSRNWWWTPMTACAPLLFFCAQKPTCFVDSN